jgi:hypothetical protein
MEIKIPSKKHKTFIEKIIPKFIRRPIKELQAKKTILNHYASLPNNEINDEEIAALNYLKDNKLSVFPYAFQENYKRKNITVYKDKDLKLKYILLDGKRLYFKRKSSTRGIKRNYNFLLIEQDINSPHRYLTENFNIGNQDILVDVGSAEGNLALSVIEKVKKVYLFETDENWIEALQATFAPWKNKVEIINKFVADKNDNKSISLDQFFKDKDRFTFLKIDAEGAEDKVLEGCKSTLNTNNPLKIAICCYHRPNDESIFDELLTQHGFSNSFSNGYMIFNEPKTFFPPYLRRGVLRGERK